MSKMGYERVQLKRCHGFKGFRLNPRRFSVKGLRSKFLMLLKMFKRWKSSYGNSVQNLRRSKSRNGSKNWSCSRRNLVAAEVSYCSDYALHHYVRSNSFYSEAIADCLDFIKRNSYSMDENPATDDRTGETQDPIKLSFHKRKEIVRNQVI